MSGKTGAFQPEPPRTFPVELKKNARVFRVHIPGVDAFSKRTFPKLSP